MAYWRSDKEELILARILEEVKTLAKRTNRMVAVELDLSVERSWAPAGLEAPERVYRWLTVERCDDQVEVKLKQTDGSVSSPLRVYEGSRVVQHDFLEVYVKNRASPGRACRLVAGYWEG